MREYFAVQKTILVVDDDAGVLRFVTRLLTLSDYKVLSASTGVDALQQSRGYGPDIDLLLSDFQMPAMNGLDLAAQLSLERPQIKVLIMSGFSGSLPGINEEWHFVPKPFAAAELRSVVAELIPPETFA
jgi:two-component system cell cycle sensor histidine kinase/response regulator CckA